MYLLLVYIVLTSSPDYSIIRRDPTDIPAARRADVCSPDICSRLAFLMTVNSIGLAVYNFFVLFSVFQSLWPFLFSI